MSRPVDLDKRAPTAAIEVRLLPWRPRRRRLRRDREYGDAGELILNVAGDLDDAPALAFGLIALGFGLVVAPAVLLLVAVILLPVEILVVLLLGALLLIIRFAGIVPWTVVVSGRAGEPRIEHYRNVITAIKRTRAVNGDRRVPIRFSLS